MNLGYEKYYTLSYYNILGIITNSLQDPICILLVACVYVKSKDVKVKLCCAVATLKPQPKLSKTLIFQSLIMYISVITAYILR